MAQSQGSSLMPNWLRRIFTTIGATDAMLTEPWLFHLLIATINTIRNEFADVRKAWSNFWYGAHQIWWQLGVFSWITARQFWWIIIKIEPFIWRRVIWVYYWAKGKIDWVYRYLLWRIVKLYVWALQQFTYVMWFAIHKILMPLIALTARFWWTWTFRIFPLWNLVMNVVRLASWIFWAFIDLLEREAMQVAKRTTRFFVALVAHNLRTLLLILEDAITNVL